MKNIKKDINFAENVLGFSDSNKYYVYVAYIDGRGDYMRINCSHIGPMTEDEAKSLAKDFRSKYKSRRKGYTLRYEVLDHPIGIAPRFRSESDVRRELEDSFNEYNESKNQSK